MGWDFKEIPGGIIRGGRPHPHPPQRKEPTKGDFQMGLHSAERGHPPHPAPPPERNSRMFFWIFMLVMDLLIPLTMLVLGRNFMKKAPAEINPIFGYRTAMSMKNRETWEFAHKYCGKIWYVCGWIMLPITVILLLLVMGRDEECVEMAGGMICLLQMIPLLGSIIPTEIALRRTFDQNGEKK